MRLPRRQSQPWSKSLFGRSRGFSSEISILTHSRVCFHFPDGVFEDFDHEDSIAETEPGHTCLEECRCDCGVWLLS